MYYMDKKKKSPGELINFRPKPEDRAVVEFIQEEISVPGMEANTTDAIRRALHAFANDLRARKSDRRKEKS